MKIERLLSILVVLLNKEVASADELAKKFEVSKRTIYRDIESLAMAGLPVVTIHGRNGGVRLMPSYTMDKYLFSDIEKQSIINALNMQKTMLQEDSETLINKLENLIGSNASFHNLSFYSPTIHRKEIEEEIKDKVIALREAIAMKKKVEITYVSLHGDLSTRVISPFHMHLNDGSWYIEAYCEIRSANRVFKLTRIREYILLDDQTMEIHRKEFTSPPSDEMVSLVFEKNQLGKLYDFFIDEEIEILEDSINVTFTYDRNKNIIPFLLMFGCSVDVMEPVSLKKQYYNELNKIYRKINDDNQLSYIP